MKILWIWYWFFIKTCGDQLQLIINHYFNYSRRRTEQFLQWRKHEEARRFAVDSAIKELFARDFQYRKELKSHIENRLQNAEKRRRSLRQRSIEVRKYSALWMYNLIIQCYYISSINCFNNFSRYVSRIEW